MSDWVQPSPGSTIAFVAIVAAVVVMILAGIAWAGRRASEPLPRTRRRVLGVGLGAGVWLALTLFGRLFASRLRTPQFRSDSAAAIATTIKLSSPTAALNFVGAEVALELEAKDIADVVGAHLPGKLNTCSDYLSIS